MLSLQYSLEPPYPASLACLPTLTLYPASLPYFPTLPLYPASIPCLYILPPYPASLPCIPTQPLYPVSLSCLSTLHHYPASLPCLLTLPTYPVSLLCLLTLFTYPASVHCLRGRCSADLYWNRCGGGEPGCDRGGKAMTGVDPLAWLDQKADFRSRAGLQRQLEPRSEQSTLVDFASNDYLKLSRDPRVVTAAVQAAQHWGAGATGSRLVTGSTELHAELEHTLAALTGARSALVFSSGYLANLAVPDRGRWRESRFAD